MQETLRGTAHRYGKNVDTDVIIPGKYCSIVDPVELGKHALEGLDPEFATRVRPGDMIVAETNFGCGSSREVAPIALKSAGVSAVVAKSFARIFYRNALNIGLPILECPQAVDDIANGEDIEIQPATGTIRNHSRDREYRAAAFPPFMQSLIDAGGLVPYVEKRLAESATDR